ncbi:MAG TPA: asparagine synthase-related protein [Solirubrobacterales bacterium]|nr:asparagine synthase-related protein [Solirubrobacterales bacterium]
MTELARRNPLGSRPLVYTSRGSGALWAEHEHELIARLPATPAPDPLALRSWLEYGTLPPGRTLYEGIQRLPPGCRLLEVDGSLRIDRHWRPRFAGTFSGGREEVAERLRGEVFAAVARAAAGEGLTAIRLSGGLDSAALAAGLRARPAPSEAALGFSLVFPEHPEADERELTEASAVHTGLSLEQVPVARGQELLPAVRRHIERWRLPPVTPNLFLWEPLMARARAAGAIRMLDGEGGDELFGTAPDLIAEMLRRGRLLCAWELCGRIPGVGPEPGRGLRLRAMRRFGIAPLLPARIRRRRRIRRTQQWQAGSLLSEADRIEQAEIEPERLPAEGPLWWRWLAAALTDVDALDVASQLRREEVDGGIERRHPFLFDLELVEAVLRLPPELGFDPLRDRSLLRDALAGHVAEAVRGRTAKARFNPLSAEALAAAEGQRMLAALAEPGAPVRAYVVGAALDGLIAAPRASPPGARELQLWRLGIADLWLRSL